MKAPDALVLGGGGLLGEVWMNAVLAGLEQACGVDARDAGGFVGTSAGSVVAAALAAGVRPASRLKDAGHADRAEDALAGAGTDGGDGSASEVEQRLQAMLGMATGAAAPLASLAIGSRASTAAGALLRRALLATLPAGRRSLSRLGGAIERLDLRWDGRLRITAVELHSGRRVVFGSPGSPALPVSSAVQASCAVPGVFAPVRDGARAYVDGGVWSPTNIDAAAVVGDARVLCLNPTGSLRIPRRAPMPVVGGLSRTMAATEALALRRRGASVRIVSPDEDCRRAMGANFFDARRGKRVAAAGLQQGRRLARSLDGF